MEDTIEAKVDRVRRCPGCEVEVREGSDYCFNCGVKVSDVESPNQGPISEEPKSNGFRADGPGAVSVEKREKGRRERRARRPISNEPVQVVWERDQDPGIKFLLFSLIAGVLAVLMLAIAYYYR